MRARQWRNGSQSAVLLAQLFNWTEFKCTQRAGFDTYGLFPLGDARITTIALRHVPFFSIVLWCAVRTSHVAVAAADTNIFINHHKAIFTLMHCAAGADFCTCGVIAMVTGDGEIISEHVLVPDAIIFLPVAASIFINTAETDFRAKIFKIFARQFAGFTASTAAGIDKNPYCVVMGYSLNLSIWTRLLCDGFPLPAVKGGERSEY